MLYLPDGLTWPAEKAEQAEPLSNRLKAPPSAAYPTSQRQRAAWEVRKRFLFPYS